MRSMLLCGPHVAFQVSISSSKASTNGYLNGCIDTYEYYSHMILYPLTLMQAGTAAVLPVILIAVQYRSFSW